jgi:hypothetical protein
MRRLLRQDAGMSTLTDDTVEAGFRQALSREKRGGTEMSTSNTNPRAVRLAYHHYNADRHRCFVCEKIDDSDFWLGDVSHLSDHHQNVAVCKSCVISPVDLRSELAEKADKLFASAMVARDLAATLLPPTPDEIRDATVIPALPFAANLVSKKEFDEWLVSRKVAGSTVNADTCEIHVAAETGALYVRGRDLGSDTRGWVHENDLSPEKLVIIRDRMKPRPPAPYSERDPAPVPF